MHSFAEVLAFLERRDRRLRGSVIGLQALSAGSGLALGLALASTFVPQLPRWLFLIPLILGFVGALVLYVLAGRAARPRSQLLYEVDVRLDLEARLSSLLTIEERSSPHIFADRVFADVLRRTPDWRRGLPVPREALIFGIATASLTVLALVLAICGPIPGPAARSVSGLEPSAAVSAEAVAAESDSEPIDVRAIQSPAGEATPSPTAQESARSQRTLSEILSDLRPALSGSSSASADMASTAPPESEPSWSELESELGRIEDRLQTSDAPLSDQDLQTLRTAAASSPDLLKAIDEAAESSNLDALRQTMTQLLSPSTPQAGPTTASTRSEVQPEDASGGDSPVVPSNQAAAESDASSGPPAVPSGGTQGEAQALPPSEGETQIFDSGIGEVAPAAPPVVVGSAGETASYITSGVPAEAASDSPGEETRWVLSPSKVRSLLTGRDLPSDAAEIVRDYFQRITEENP